MRRRRIRLKYIHKTNSPSKSTRKQFLRDTMNTVKPTYPVKVTTKNQEDDDLKKINNEISTRGDNGRKLNKHKKKT